MDMAKKPNPAHWDTLMAPSPASVFELATQRPPWTEMMAGLAGGEPTEGERHQLQARSHHDVWDRLPQLALPVLIAAGRFDGIALPANQEALARQIEGADLRWFDGGHAFFLQDRTALPAIADWLAAG